MFFMCETVAVEYKTCIGLSDDAIHEKAYEAVGKLTAALYNMNFIEIRKTELGKPYFEDNLNIKMSISHTDDFFAVAVCADCEIGIDTERIHAYDSKLIKKFYTIQEREVLDNAKDFSMVATCIWTEKEAHCKCTGEGITLANLKWNTVGDLPEFVKETIVVGKYVISICKRKRQEDE